MLTMLLDRRTGLLRPASRQGSLNSPGQVPPKPAPIVSPITVSLLEALGIRHALAQQYAPLLRIAASRYHIDTTPRRLAAWLATIAHESARLTRVVENLNYSGEGLAATWPARYADITGQPNTTALRIARKPEQIANLTYAGRMGNGTAGSGDGWHFRGRGLIQITGRSNYAAATIALGEDFIFFPQLLETPKWAARSAAWFWSRHALNALADAGEFDRITRRINGGLNGLDDRLRLYSAALRYFGVST